MTEFTVNTEIKTLFQEVYNTAVTISNNVEANNIKSSNSNVVQLIRVNTIKLRKIYVDIIDLETQDEKEQLKEYMNSLIQMILLYISTFKLNVADINNSLDIDNIMIRFITNYFVNWYKYEKSEQEESESGEYLNHFEIFFKMFLNQVFKVLIANEDANIRFITLKIMILLFENFEELDSEDYNLILKKIKERIYDKDEKVRTQAIIALAKFQNDSKNLNKFVSLLRNDPSSLVRKLIIANISSNQSSSAHSYILERYMDKAVDVRKEVYNSFLLKKFNNLEIFKKIRNTLVIKIVYNGFILDREYSINEINHKLLLNWFKHCDYNLETFFKCFNVNEVILKDKITLNKLESIFENFIYYFLIKQKENPRIKKIDLNLEEYLKLLMNDHQNISLEQSFILKFLHRILSIDPELTNINDDMNIPTTLELIDFLKKFNPKESLINKTIYMNLLDIAKITQDFKDELSRRSMLQFLRECIINFEVEGEVEITAEQIEEELHDEIEELVTLCPLIKKIKDENGSEYPPVNIPYSTINERILNLAIDIIFSKLSLNNLDFLDIVMNLIWDMRDQEEEELEREAEKQKLLEKETIDIGKKRRRPSSLDKDDLDLPNMSDSDDESEKEEDKSIFVKERPSLTPKTLTKILKISEVMLLQLPNPAITGNNSNTINTVASIENNLYFESLIDTLVTPAIRQNELQPLRNLGVSNLGLVCLLDVNLMRENLHIFGMCASKHLPTDQSDRKKLRDALIFRDVSLKAILDALLTFEINRLLPDDNASEIPVENPKTTELKLFSTFKIFYKILKENESRKTDNLIVTGVFKLFLYQKIDHLDLLQLLILIYYYPINSNNFKLLQTFASFIPTLCFSSLKNQNLLVELVPDLIFRLLALYEENEKTNKKNEKAKQKKRNNTQKRVNQNNQKEEEDEDEDEDSEFVDLKMKTPSEIIQELLYWSNPLNLKIHTIDNEEKELLTNHLKITEILLFHYHKIFDQDFIKLYRLMTKNKSQLNISYKHPLDYLVKLKLRIEYLNDELDIPLLTKENNKKVPNQFYDFLCQAIEQNCTENNISKEKLAEIENFVTVEDEDNVENIDDDEEEEEEEDND
ncbi:hypothetical protein HANVADRAFT_49645 [Hanseniaspora valbyensis NRRL Y-1626]|uniref:Nuclear condensin complex subunit 3 C-terminal domain-containing protein n=1 Tax=Hanseniaspora valbyensis NRRL Y-1626 TaxID=766949 RepID=A0A1B7TAX3_9ASCO|nr:hypothetical protein HANVADRAFT_49645 [Hanseniaspora valbyensis NRRL Y-1626]